MAGGSRPEIDSLGETVGSALNLMKQFNNILSKGVTSATTNELPNEQPEPLAVLKTSATLLKAHTTKLSLLILNRPFTPSAIAKIISQISSTCLPAMMSAVEICRAEKYGTLLQSEVTTRVRRIFTEVDSMMQEIMVQVDKTKGQNTNNAPPSRDTLSSTGVVWEACDALIELQQMGMVGLVIKKAQQYRDMLEDAMAELKEWSDDVDDGKEEPDDDFTGSDGGDSDEEFFSAANRLPKDREDLSTLLGECFKKLKLLSTLYQALIKRRLKTVHASFVSSHNEDINTTLRYTNLLDKLIQVLKTIPDIVDDLAHAFYELNADEAQKLLDASCNRGIEAMNLMKKSWTGEEDEFTAWSNKWLEAVNGNPGAVLTKS